MEFETYKALKKLCAINDIEMNTIFQEAAEKTIAQYGNGLPMPKKEPELPSIFATRDEILRWAFVVGPDGARKARENLAFLQKHLIEQARAIELNEKNKIKTLSA